MNEIPKVSMKDFHAAGERKKRFATELGDAFRSFGFVRITERDIPLAWFDTIQASARQLFAQPKSALMPFHRPEIDCQRGYVPHRLETAAGYDKPDEKACWHFGRDSVQANVVPPEEMAPGFRLDCARLFNLLDHLYIDLMKALEIYFDLPHGFFMKMVRGANNSLLRIAFYPKFIGDEQAGALRAQAHPDINLLTLLPAASAAGLEIQLRDGSWLPVRPVPGEIIVNSGLMLERVTNGAISATWHRVVNPNGKDVPNEDRISTPFFGHPLEQAVLEVPAMFTGEGYPEPKPPITAGEALKEVLNAIKLTASPAKA